MAILRKENAIIEEEDKGRIQELKLAGYEEITEEDLKPKKESAAKPSSK